MLNSLQIMKYEQGDKYGNHHDYFAADYYETVEEDMVDNVQVCIERS